jgi:MAF protein
MPGLIPGRLVERWPMKLILASASPRRRDLLRQCGIECEILNPAVPEDASAGETPEELVVRLAREKARAAAGRIGAREALILAADTVVADGTGVLGKPESPQQAGEFLLRLRGREHRVITGVCLLQASAGTERTRSAVTAVRMRAYSDAELAAYAAGGDALDKAGAYAIQDAAFHPVESIAGCYTNVVGLPLCRVYALLEAAGERPERPLPDGCRAGGPCGFLPEAFR